METGVPPSNSHRRPESFDRVAELYERARPTYPAELVDDLVRLSGLHDRSRVLEVGAGSGQLTVPLASHGFQLIAVEPGEHLAAIARQKLDSHPKTTVIVSPFEEWALPPEPFDLVVSATAFHWLDPAIRVQKSYCCASSRWGLSHCRDALGRWARA